MEIIREYTKNAPITRSDDALLDVVVGEIPGVRISAVTVEWVEKYVATLKLEQNLAPGTIRKRVGVLARVMHWHTRRTTAKGLPMPANPLRGLPTGYSAYSRDEAARLSDGQVVKVDVQRDRRLHPQEEVRMRLVLEGGKMLGKRKGLKKEPTFLLLFNIILDTGLRLQEAFSLRVDQLELAKGFIRVDGSKGARGKIKPRTVPIRPTLVAQLQARIEEVEGDLVFPWWGQPNRETKAQASRYLSKRFAQMFEYAQVDDFTEHDLRHEATCRWVQLKDAAGRWAFTEGEIAKIMGWTGMTMMLRYLSLRGEDLANRFG